MTRVVVRPRDEAPESRPRASLRPRCAIVVGDGEFGMRVVGTSRYQFELEVIAGGHGDESTRDYDALLLPATDRPDDAMAVAVQIEGTTVGFLERHIAPSFTRELAEQSYFAARCSARITDWAAREGENRSRFVVRLDAFRPFALRDLEPDEETPLAPSRPVAAPKSTVVRPSIAVTSSSRRSWSIGKVLQPLCVLLMIGAVGAIAFASEYHRSRHPDAAAAQSIAAVEAAAAAAGPAVSEPETAAVTDPAPANASGDPPAFPLQALSPAIPAPPPSAIAPEAGAAAFTGRVPLPRPRPAQPPARQTTNGGFNDYYGIRQTFFPVPDPEEGED